MPLGSKADWGSMNVWELHSLCQAAECSRREEEGRAGASLFAMQGRHMHGRRFAELPWTPHGPAGAFWEDIQEINGPINSERRGMLLFEYEMVWNFHSEGAKLGIPIAAVWQSWYSISAWLLNLAGWRAFFSWAVLHFFCWLSAQNKFLETSF